MMHPPMDPDRPYSLTLRVGARHGLSLLEVLVALAIFLMALTAIGYLITQGGNRALHVQQQGQATQLCQAKLAEIIAGAVPLTSQSDVPFDEDPEWLWSVDAEPGSITGLWKVSVRVSRQRSDGSRLVSTLNQMVLDPSLRGSTFDTPPPASSDTSDSSAGSTASSSPPTAPGASSPPPATGPAAGSAPKTGASSPSSPPAASAPKTGTSSPSSPPATSTPKTATPPAASAPTPPPAKAPSAPPAPPASSTPKSGGTKGGN